MNPEKTQKNQNYFKDIVKFIVISLLIVIPIRIYIAQPFIVSGASMDPTFSDGQYLIVDQLTYHLDNPKRGDVIIFKYPNNPKIYYIKRIIALPNETITMESGIIKIINDENPNGFILDDSYITNEHKTTDSFTMTLNSTEYFVMGDNRPRSSDSRIWGPLERKYIVGRPLLRLLPFSEISVFPGM